MVRSQSRVLTASARKYLVALCKHWAHHLPTETITGGGHLDTGRVEFPSGVGVFEADDAVLVMHLTCPDAETLAALETGVRNHLARFAFRENLDIIWLRQAAEV